MKTFLRILCTIGLSTLISASGLAAQDAVPFSKEFTPNEMGPGSSSELVFTISNNGATPVSALSFTDTLPVSPGAMTIIGSAASTDCPFASLTAPAGGGTISFSGGQLGVGDSCTVRVNVTANATGTYTNTSSILTYGGGASGAATDDLEVFTTLPGFIKAFALGRWPSGWATAPT